MISRTQADIEFLSRRSIEKCNIESDVIDDRCCIGWEKTAKYGLIIGGVAVIGYGVYKFTPKLKSWWKGRKQTDIIDEDIFIEKNVQGLNDISPYNE